MPTYQYRCTDCGHELEEFQSFTDDALTVCPVCGGRLRKLFNAVGVVFKGSGFYRTDSRSSEKSGAGSTSGTKDSPSSGSSDSAGSAASTGGSSTSSDSSSGSSSTTTKAPASTGSSSAGGGGSTSD